MKWNFCEEYIKDPQPGCPADSYAYITDVDNAECYDLRAGGEASLQQVMKLQTLMQSKLEMMKATSMVLSSDLMVAARIVLRIQLKTTT